MATNFGRTRCRSREKAPGDLTLRKAVQAVYHLGHLRSLATSYLLSAAFEPAAAPPVAPHRTA
jgi:hypothetical protein